MRRLGKLLPDYRQLTPVKTGTVANFDIGVSTRDEHVGIQFSGFLVVPQEGLSTFGTVSDDGSMLYLGDATPPAKVVGLEALPAPRRLVLGQSLSEREERQWAECEGNVMLVKQQGEGLELELASGGQRARVIVADGSSSLPLAFGTVGSAWPGFARASLPPRGKGWSASWRFRVTRRSCA